MNSEIITCLICNEQLKSSRSLSYHIRNKHQMNSKEYYDQYLKTDSQEGKCAVCGEPTEFASLKYGYKTHCSRACSYKSPERIKKSKQTCLKRYGTENGNWTPEARKKREETNLKKFGVKNAFASKEIKEKIKQTNLERYGVTSPSKNKEVIKQMEDTNLSRYGVRYPIQSPKIQAKIKQTCLKKYGTENGNWSPEARKKRDETNLKKFGVKNPAQSEIIQAKIRNTNLTKYGATSPIKLAKFKDKAQDAYFQKSGVKNIWQKHITNYEDWLNLKQFLTEHDHEFTTMDLCRYFNVSYQNTRNKLRKEGLDCFVKDFYTLSEPEEAFSQELDKLNIEYELHNRKVIAPLEVDFYLPKYKLALEISPTWTHQYITEEQTEQNFMGVTDQDYHYNKFKLCKEQGIELITIFDWTDTDKVLSFIKSKTLATETIYARKTTTHLVKGLTKKHKDFLDRNHILGKVNNSSTTEVVEMYYNIQLVGLAVFEKKTKYTELRRLAFEGNYRIPGGASKLIKTFAREHPELKELITFSDNDLGTGHVYEKLGFKILEENKGALIWYNDQYGKKIPNLSLIKQGTDRLLKNFPGYECVGQGDDLPGNEEIIQWYGFVPIYDCGYTKWVLAL